MGTDTHRHACASRHSGGEFTLPGAERHYPPDLGIEPIHMDIALTLDLAERTADGRVTITVRARREGPRELSLNAVGFEGVAVSGLAAAPVEGRYDGELLHLCWAEPFAVDEVRQVVVSYALKSPVTGLFFSHPSDLWPDAPWFAATDNEAERARHWLPCVDLPNVRCTLDYHLRAAARFTILAGGELVGEDDHEDGTKTAHWRLAIPCPSYLACFAVGDFVRCDDGRFGELPIAYFTVPPHTEEDLRRSFGRTPEMLAWLTERLDRKLPFPKYFQFALPGIGGAMENISLVSWDDHFVLDEVLATEWAWLVDVINVHEMAHSFFGDLVVCRDYAHVWLKESWATYMEQVWLEDQGRADEAQWVFWDHAQAYFKEADSRYKRPIVTREFNTSWDMFDRHLYPGGACRLHTLRYEVGDGPFWLAVRDYVAEFEGKVVETDDFRRVVERRSGRSLGRFFDQWFHAKGYPCIKASFAWSAERKEGTFTLEQTQKDDAQGIPLFELSLDVGWVVGGELHTMPIRVHRERHEVVVPMDTDPEQVRVDPLSKCLIKLDFSPGDDRLRRQLTEATDATGRILAASALCKSGKRGNIEAVREAALAEPFWGVRIEMAKALSEAATAAATDALAALVRHEQHPLVLEHLLRAAGALRDPAVAEALLGRASGSLPYRALAAAYEGLGAQREAAPFELLRRAAETEGFGGIAQSGALRALAATRKQEALPVLMAASTPGGSSERARPAAVAALGSLGQALDKRERATVVERLCDLLRDPSHLVRSAAVGALAALEAREAESALEAHRRGLAEQDKVRIDRVLATLRSGDSPKVTGLEKQVEELRAKLRAIEERVAKTEGTAAAAREKAAPPSEG